MEKLKMESLDLMQRNIQRIGALFQNVIVETRDKNGRLKKGINFELLKQELSGDVIDGDESYEFNWVGKRAAIVESNSPIRKTLRPCMEESRDWENTENLFIEGDNLEVLKLLQESYLNSIKMIYIDPPYNTGKDFIYKDRFVIGREEYGEQIGLYDEDNNKLFQNTETNGRFHSDWCSMMYPRLKLANNLLSDDGVIFISIDDNEVDNLKKICSEVFGESNFIAQCVRKRRDSQANLSPNISPIHEYLLIYAKSNGEVLNKIAADIDESNYKNPDNDERGPYVTMPCTNKGGAVYSVTTPTGNIITEEWRFKEETYYKLLSENKIVFPKGGEGKPRYKLFLSEKKEQGVLANTWLDNIASNQEATREIKEIFGELLFDTPKPTGLLRFCLNLASNKDSIILDFFAGSCTTAHAVMQLNAEDGGSRKFIMVQLPEKIDEKSQAYKMGYKNICEIGKERIRKAGENINEEIVNKNNQLKPDEEAKSLVDTGFRVLKVDTTNMKDVYYAANEYDQLMLADLESNIKEDRTDLDLLYGVHLDWGRPLSLKHKIEEIEGVSIHTVDEDSLVACFEERVPESVVREIAGRKPQRVVFRDSSFGSSSDKINVEEIFKLLSPNTIVKVI